MVPQYGLIGFPLGHSFSKDYFTSRFATEAIQAVYALYPLKEIGQITSLIAENPDLKGLNVTIPYKQAIMPYLDEISDEARAIGAVNTISISGSGGKTRLKGWNTDAAAFEMEMAEFPRTGCRRALVLGNGGAAAAAVFVLRKLGFEVKQAIRNQGPDGPGFIAFARLNPGIMQETDLIVNATPAGMYPASGEMPPIPVECLDSRHDVFDMVYNPEVTRLMHEAQLRGARVRNGLGMLHRQADLAWKIWTASND